MSLWQGGGVFAALLLSFAWAAAPSAMAGPQPAAHGSVVVASDTVDVSAFDPARLRVGEDSMAIRMQGFPEGSRVARTQRTHGGFRYIERVAVTADVHRTTEVWFDDALGIDSVTWSGSNFGTATGGSVAYDQSAALGTVQATLPLGAIDGHALMPLLWTLDWLPGTVYRLTLFEPEDGSSSRQTLTVVGPEVVSVPAGEFGAIRGELTSTQLPVTLWVTRDVPHRLLKIASATGETVLIR